MQAFKPKKKPLWENPILQIAVIVVIAALLVKNIMGNSATSLMGKRARQSQGFTRSERKSGSTSQAEDQNEEEAYASSTAENAAETDATTSKNSAEKNQPNGKTRAAAAAGMTASGTALADVQNPQAASAGYNYRLRFAEISNELANKWISDSNSQGLYEPKGDYSVGILNDFSSRREIYKGHLKEANIKIKLGESGVNLSGVMSDDGAQLIGFATAVELKSADNYSQQGSITVTKNSRQQGVENFESDFELPRGSALFILGALKTENFAAERDKLLMPPFQILKSPDFMTHKTQFVIILQPDYK